MTVLHEVIRPASAGRTSAFSIAVCLAAMVVICPRAAAAGDITLAWDPSPGSVAGYRVFFGTASGVYTGELDAGNKTSATVSGLTSGDRYYFIVKAYSASGVLSAPSNEVDGLVPWPPFTDDPLLPGVHTAKAVHVGELRARIDALRKDRGQPVWSWEPVDAGTAILASHITELRKLLYAEFVGRGKTPPAHLTLPLNAGTAIRASDITDLRLAVMALR